VMFFFSSVRRCMFCLNFRFSFFMHWNWLVMCLILLSASSRAVSKAAIEALYSYFALRLICSSFSLAAVSTSKSMPFQHFVRPTSSVNPSLVHIRWNSVVKTQNPF
jgi:hypothetical protein